jgi:hypothetical protein
MPEEVLGNVEALDVVLADPRVGNADAVVVGGDAVPGPVAGWPGEESVRAALEDIAGSDR